MNRLKYKLIMIIIVICFLQLTNYKLYSQNLVIPPSPNATSLGEYVNTPVNLFSGIPDINVPIYELNTNNFKIPLYLSYKANGIKVEDIASNVGLGWTLNAGGLITRSVHGIPDDFEGKIAGREMKGYLSNLSAIYNFNLSASEDDKHGRLLYFSHNNLDTEPDIFYFNFLGRTGKFVFDRNKKVSQIPYSNLLIDCTFNVEKEIIGFDITDENGIKYEFKETENSTITHVNKYIRFGNFIIPIQTSQSYSFNSSWYLSKIIMLNKKEIEFNYDDIQNISFEQRILENTKEECNEIDCVSNTDILKINQAIATKNITKIITDNSKVEFTYLTSREDLAGSKCLTNIDISSINGNQAKVVRKYQLNYNYFLSPGGTTEKYKRLCLTSVVDKTVSKNKNTIFEYNYIESGENEIRLPNRSSMEQDVWGYYNANGASTLIPKIYIYPLEDDKFRVYPIEGYTNEKYELGGAYRLPNGEKMQANILKKIIYPTGGSAEFIYEPNKFVYDNAFYEGAGLRIESIVKHDGTNIANDIITNYSYEDISLGQESSGVLFFKPKFANLDFRDTELAVHAPDDVVMDFWNGVYGGKEDFFANFLLRYNINISMFGASSQPIGYKEVKVEKGGAYSIYKYSCPGAYQDLSDLSVSMGGACDEQLQGYCDGLYERSQVYAQPTSLFKDDDAFNEYEYFPHISVLSDNYPYPLNANYDWNRGLLLQKDDYNNDNKLVKEVKYEYDLFYANGSTNPQVIYGIKFSKLYLPIKHVRSTGNYQYPYNHQMLPIAYSKYPIYTNVKKVLSSVLTKEYNQSDHTNYISIENNHLYNNHGLLSFTGTLNSKGGSLQAQYTYPKDLIQDATAAILGNSLGSPLVIDFKQTIQVKLLSPPSGTPPPPLMLYFEGRVNRSLNFYEMGTKSIELPEGSYNVYIGNDEGRIDIEYKKYKDDAIKTMIDKNIIAIPLETKIKNVTEDKTLVTKTTNYRIDNPSDPKGEWLVVPSETIEKYGNESVNASKIIYDKYDDKGNLLQYHKENDINNSYVWGYNGQYPIASAANAKHNDIYFTSFDDGPEIVNWGNPYSFDYSKSKTGRASLKSNIPETGGYYYFLPFIDIDNPQTKKYKYSCWVYSNKPGVALYFFYKPNTDDGQYSSGWKAVNVSTNELNKWVYLEGEVSVPNNMKRIYLRVDNNGGGPVWYDDVKFWAEGAQLTTYTYEPLVGMTSQTNPAGKTTTYEYDDFGRLTLTKDHNGNIVERNSYHYIGQAIDGFNLESATTRPVSVDPSNGDRTVTLDVRVRNADAFEQTCNITCAIEGVTRDLSGLVSGNSAHTFAPTSWTFGPGAATTKQITISGSINESLTVDLPNTLPANMVFNELEVVVLNPTQGALSAKVKYNNTGSVQGSVNVNLVVYKYMGAGDIPTYPDFSQNWELISNNELTIIADGESLGEFGILMALQNGKYRFIVLEGTSEMGFHNLVLTTVVPPPTPSLSAGVIMDPLTGETQVGVTLLNANCDNVKVILYFVEPPLSGQSISPSPSSGIILSSSNCTAIFDVTNGSGNMRVQAITEGGSVGTIFSSIVTVPVSGPVGP